MGPFPVDGGARCRVMLEMRSDHHKSLLYMCAPSFDDSMKHSTPALGVLAMYVVGPCMTCVMRLNFRCQFSLSFLFYKVGMIKTTPPTSQECRDDEIRSTLGKGC